MVMIDIQQGINPKAKDECFLMNPYALAFLIFVWNIRPEKTSIDMEIILNYRPVSNSTFLGKIIKKLKSHNSRVI